MRIRSDNYDCIQSNNVTLHSTATSGASGHPPTFPMSCRGHHVVDNDNELFISRQQTFPPLCSTTVMFRFPLFSNSIHLARAASGICNVEKHFHQNVNPFTRETTRSSRRFGLTVYYYLNARMGECTCLCPQSAPSPQSHSPPAKLLV